MTEYKIQTEKLGDVDTVKFLLDLSKDISKSLPEVVFKPRQMNTWGISREEYPNGVCESLNVFHTDDLNNHIGVLEVSMYYREADKPKYGITSINIQDGRQTYGGEGAYKYSIHAKNIVRIARKVFKPFTFDQIADRCKKEFANNISSISNNMRWELRQKMCDGYQHLIDDFENLYHLGYKPDNAKFKQMMEFVIENKERIKKYENYDPEHYFVLVQDGNVQYRLSADKGKEPHTVQNKEQLPEDIRGKLFVLDITDQRSFVEDVGLKENDGAYWIIA